MLYLAFIYHMHQPYYKNLLTQETAMPWVRLHGTKDYLDMLIILEKYPLIRQTFNLVPSLLEQIDDYVNRTVKDKFWELSLKGASELNADEKKFIRDNFFKINKDTVIAYHPRYYELFFKKEAKKEFSLQDYLDLQVWFNLAWIDPIFRQNFPELKQLLRKGRFFTEEEKGIVLDKQIEILEEIIPAYKKIRDSGQIEITLSPYYHPILPLLFSTKIAKEANLKTALPNKHFICPEDAKAQIDLAVRFYENTFQTAPFGMWPSEEAVSEHILPLIIRSGIRWIVTDEAILFKSLKKKRREAALIYQPHLLKRKDGTLYIVFRDRNLSDLIGFEYQKWGPQTAVDDFLRHLKNIADTFKDEDILVSVALDGENAWEYYLSDGHDFLELLYQGLSVANFVKTTTVSEYLKTHPPTQQIKHLVAGSWIYADFGKWIGSPYKNKAWECLAEARLKLKQIIDSKGIADTDKLNLAWKQIYICEGSDWFWWYGDDHAEFDSLFRMHLVNFYRIIDQQTPNYLNKPLIP